MTLPITASILASLALAACAPTGGRAKTTEAETNVTSPNAETTDADLVYLREEEKLARDVYLALFERWKLPVFDNIASSEQRHLDLATAQLERRGLTDENYSDKPGAFENDSLKALYDGFIEKGSTSLTAALEVGATIEDLDIRDLDAMIAANPEPSLRASLETLRCASGNHMRAFTSQLERRGETYRAQYISQERLDEVLGQEHQRCGQMGEGTGMRQGRGGKGKGHGGKGMGHGGKGMGHGGKGMGRGRRGEGKGMGHGKKGGGRQGKGVVDRAGVHVVDLKATVDGAGSEAKDKEVRLLLETPRLKLATITLRDGTVLPAHATPMPVTIQSLSGTGIVRVRGNDYALSPGVLIALAPSEEHSVIPANDSDLVVLVHHLKSPAK